MQDLLSRRATAFFVPSEGPDGRFALDANMLMFIEDESMRVKRRERFARAQEQSDAGKVALDRGEVHAAIELLAPVVQQAPQLLLCAQQPGARLLSFGKTEIARTATRRWCWIWRRRISTRCATLRSLRD
jgi:hypothetical protein